MNQNQPEDLSPNTPTATPDMTAADTVPVDRPKKPNRLLTFLQRKLGPWFAEYGYLLIAAAVPVVLMYLLYLAREIYPFGDGCVLVLDLNGQYSAFYHGLRDVLKGDASLLYSFCRNMGGEFLGIYDYYVASPFAWLVALFPETRMLEALLILFLIKTGLLGFNMGFYLHKTAKGEPKKLAVISIAILYAMSAYAIIQQHNSMWIDAMLWLPILTYGIEELIKRGRWRLYTFILALTIFSNFYIGYMVVIYTVAYCFYWYFAHNRNNENNPTGEKNHFARSVGRVFVWSALAVGMSALAILSARYSLSLGKDVFSTPNWAVKQKFDLLDLLYKLLPSSYDTVRPDGLPFVYCGTLTLLLVPAYFLCRKFSAREKVASAVFILFFVASFATSSLDLIWHGFQKPNWLNYRYSFMLVFFLLTLAYKAFANIKFVSRGALMGVTAGWALVILILQRMGGYLTEQNKYLTVNEFATVWLALGCLMVYFILICLEAGFPRSRETVSIVLVFFICVEVFLSSLSDMNAFDKDVTYSKYSRYNDFLTTYLPISDMILENDDGFYRTEKTYHRKTNDNFSLNFKGLSCSTSTLNRATIDFLMTIGYQGASHKSTYVGGNPVNDSIMGIKYLVTDNKDNMDYYGDPIYPNSMFTYDEDFKPVNSPDVYLNPYALSLLFGVSDDYALFQSWTYEDDGDKDYVYDTALDDLNAMVTAMLGEDELVELFKTVEQITPTAEGVCDNCTYSTAAGHHKWAVQDTATSASVKLQYAVPTDRELFVFFPSDYPREVTMKVNGTSKGGFNGGSESTYHRIASIGKSKSETLELEIGIKNSSNNLYIKQSGDLGVYDSYIYYLDWDVFTQAFSRLAAMNMEIDHASTDDHIFGTMTTLNDNQLIASTIAWDEGWHVYVDGKPVETFETANALLSFRVGTAGDHEIELKYMPSSVRIGIISSVGCTVIYLILLLLYTFLRKLPGVGLVFAVQGKDLPPVETEEDQRCIRSGDVGDLPPFVEAVPATAPSDIDEKPFRVPPKAGDRRTAPQKNGKPGNQSSKK